jgi:hypothetical protein
MKSKFIFFVLIAFLLQSCGSSETKSCEKEGCMKSATGKGVVVSDTSKELSCTLTSAELQKRKTDVLSVLKSKILERKELPDGYSFRFANSDEMIDLLTDFIKSERQCCDFFNFSIHVRNDGVLWFDLTGPKDAKEFIGSELGLVQEK